MKYDVLQKQKFERKKYFHCLNTFLSPTAGLLLGGNRNGLEYWKDENGHSLNENKALKKKLSDN